MDIAELGVQETTWQRGVPPQGDTAARLAALAAVDETRMPPGTRKFLARCQTVEVSTLAKNDQGYIDECYFAFVENVRYTYGAYHMPVEPCPYCGEICYADWVDVGVGLVQCGPYHCGCGASEIGPHDQPRELSAEEKAAGWYAPNTPPGSSANVVDGKIVDWETAQDTYRALYPLSATEAGQALIRGV